MSADGTAQVKVLQQLYFGKDDAESDIVSGGLLRQTFLRTVAYEAVVSGRKSLIVGRKGAGKSAISVTLQLQPPAMCSVALVTPDEISADEIRRFELEGITPEQSKALLWRYVFAVRIAKFLVAHAAGDEHGELFGHSKALRKFLLDNGEVNDLRFQEKFWRMIEKLKASFSLEAFGANLRLSRECARHGG